MHTDREGLRALAVGAVGVAIMFAAVGAPLAGFVVLLIPLGGWLLSRYEDGAPHDARSARTSATASSTASLPAKGSEERGQEITTSV